MTDFTTSGRGDRIGYDRRGDGPAVVFVAGAGPFRAIDPWTTETAERVSAQGLTTVVWDRLGRGESPAEGVLDLDRELEALAAMIEVAGGSAVLCGHSSGCSISLRAAAAGLPVTGLVLWEAPLAGRAVDVAEWIAEFERRLDAGDHEGATEQYMKDMPPGWLAGVKSSSDWPRLALGSRSHRADGQSLVWAQDAIERKDLGLITAPVLCTYGTTTFAEMPMAAAMISEAVPGATIKEVAGANHAWEPAAMARELIDLVTHVEPAVSD